MYGNPLVYAIVVLTSFSCAYLSDRIAANKGVRHAGFAALGFLLGPVGVLIAVLKQPRGLALPFHAKPAPEPELPPRQPTPKRLAELGALFAIFGLGIIGIELSAGDPVFSGGPQQWGLGEASLATGLPFFGLAVWRHHTVRRRSAARSARHREDHGRTRYTMWSSLDDLTAIEPGRLCLVTGIPAPPVRVRVRTGLIRSVTMVAALDDRPARHFRRYQRFDRSSAVCSSLIAGGVPHRV